MTANLDRRASDRFGLLQRIADIGARRHREQTLLLCFRQFEAGNKIVDRFTADLVATRQALELFVWLRQARSEEHTSELQSLMRISYAVFCLKKKNHKKTT